MAQTEPTLDVQMEYRALIECDSDPCTYCRGPRRRRAQNHPGGPFPTAEAAHAHGWGMAHNVYGASAHRVLVEGRQVGPWNAIDVPARRR